MNAPSRSADIYLRFLQLAEVIRGLPSLPALDPLEERILQLVAHAGVEQQRLCVRDMMGRNDLGAPATIHTRLKSMREKGWIGLAETQDARRKQIELTPAARQHFAKLSACMVQATTGE